VIPEEPFHSVTELLRRWWCRNQEWIAIWRRPWNGNCGILRGSLTMWLSLKKWTGCKECQNFWHIYNQLGTKDRNVPSPLTSHSFIRRSIGSSSAFQRMINREQGQNEGLITAIRCQRSPGTRMASISSTRSTVRDIISIIS
jgi:hypothetical protein